MFKSLKDVISQVHQETAKISNRIPDVLELNYHMQHLYGFVALASIPPDINKVEENTNKRQCAKDIPYFLTVL